MYRSIKTHWPSSPAMTPNASGARPRSPSSAAHARCPRPVAGRTGTGSIKAATGKATWRCAASPSSACDTTSPPGTTPPGRPVRVRAGSRTSAASNGSSPVRRAGCSSPYATVGSGVGCRPNTAPDCANRAWATVSPTAGRRGAMHAVQPHQKDRTRQTGPARTRATGHPMDSLHHQSKTTHPNA